MSIKKTNTLSIRSNNKLKNYIIYIFLPIIYVIIFLNTETSLLQKTNYLTLTTFGYIASVIDIKTKLIPNKLIIYMAISWFFITTISLFVDFYIAVETLKSSLGGFLIGGGLFLFMYIISKKGIGGGDVKFIAVTGLFAGYSDTMSIMFVSSFFAGIFCLILLAIKKVKKDDAISLAPFLYIGILISVFL